MNRSALFYVFLILCVSVVLPGGLGAQCDNHGLHSVKVPFGDQPMMLAGVPVPLFNSGSAIVSPPLHGDLTISGGRFFYRPHSSFWTVGTDRFTFSYQSSVSSPPSLETVRLLAPMARGWETHQEAEQAPLPATSWAVESAHGDSLFVPAAALSGENGFWVVENPSQDTYLRARLASQFEGYGDTGSGAQGGWKPPGSGGPPGGFCDPFVCLPEGSALILTLNDRQATLTGLSSNSNSYVGVRMRTGFAGIDLRLEASPSYASAWFPVSSEPHQLALLAWDAVGDRPSGAAFYVDGELAGHVAGLGFDTWTIHEPEARFGTLDAEGVVPAQGWDHLTAFTFGTSAPRAVCLRHDDFEGGTLSSQWHTFGSQNLGLLSSIMPGSGVLEILPGGSGTPTGGLVIARNLGRLQPRRLGLRFKMDARELVLPAGSSVLLVDAANARETRSFRLLIEPTATGDQQLRLIARHEDSNLQPTSILVSFSKGVQHKVELDWQRSETDLAGTGYLRLFLDGIEVATLRALANDAQILTDVRLGGVAPVGQPSGKLLLDQAEIWYEE